ncbi:MAG: prolyl oligopeptidase family serine peptidase [Chloroflexota bacterium]
MSALQTEPRLPNPETLRDQVVLEEHDLAPDGSFAVVTRRFVEGDEYVSHLWLVPLAGGGEPLRLTTGAVRDMRPLLSPDGARVAFTRKVKDDERTSIRILDLRGGEPVAPALGTLSAGEIAWSPDGRSIAFTAAAGPHRLIVGPVPPEPGTPGAKDAKAPRARRVTTLDFRWDYEGYVDRRSQVHVVAAEDGAVPTRLTEIGAGVSGICWRPDGAAIAFTSDPRVDADLHPRTSIWEVVVPAGATGERLAVLPEPREVLALAGHCSKPAYSADGRWLVAVGVDDPDYFDDISPSLFAGPADGSAPAVALAPDFDRPIGDWADTDLFGWQSEQRSGPFWDGNGIVALVTDRGRTHPWRFPVDLDTGRPSGDPVRLAHGDTMAHTLALGGGRITVTSTLEGRPPELCLVEASGDLRPATSLGSAWTRDLAWPTLRRVEAPGPGGPVEAWIVSPAGASDEALPTVVDVHGGPLGAWAPAPPLEAVLLCARGYRVVLPNIRGSISYGAEWITPQLGHWGEVDADDVHAAVDHVVSLGLADPDRLGVLGLSYGGFMVNWLVGTTDRFRGAVSENGVTNQISTWAHSDSGAEYCRASHMGNPTTPEGIDLLWRQSPLRNVANVHTPLLMLQAEQDRRCPTSDNEQYFATLRWLGREVEYILYPEEYHGIQATGRIDRRIDRMTRMLDWFDRFLKA